MSFRDRVERKEYRPRHTVDLRRLRSRLRPRYDVRLPPRKALGQARGGRVLSCPHVITHVRSVSKRPCEREGAGAGFFFQALLARALLGPASHRPAHDLAIVKAELAEPDAVEHMWIKDGSAAAIAYSCRSVRASTTG